MAPPITKVECGLGRGRRGGWGGDVRGGLGPFYLAGTQDVSLQYHSISPEWLIPCGVAAQRRKEPFQQACIATWCHILIAVYIIRWNLGQELSAHFQLICSLWVPKSPKLKGTRPPGNMVVYRTLDITASLQIRWECGEFSQNGSG